MSESYYSSDAQAAAAAAEMDLAMSASGGRGHGHGWGHGHGHPCNYFNQAKINDFVAYFLFIHLFS